MQLFPPLLPKVWRYIHCLKKKHNECSLHTFPCLVGQSLSTFSSQSSSTSFRYAKILIFLTRNTFIRHCHLHFMCSRSTTHWLYALLISLLRHPIKAFAGHGSIWAGHPRMTDSCLTPIMFILIKRQNTPFPSFYLINSEFLITHN